VLFHNFPVPLEIIDCFYLSEYETVLPKKRDHILHTLNLLILGSYIIYKVDGLNIECTHENIKKWHFTALFHDIGYFINCGDNIILDKVERILNSRKSKIISLIGSKECSDSGEEYEKCFFKYIPNSPFYLSIIKEGENEIYSHDSVSASLLERIKLLSFDIDKNGVKNDEKLFNTVFINWSEFDQCIEAIKYHDVLSKDKCHLQASDIEHNPTISMLHIFDELQDYDRKHFNSEENDHLKIDDVKINFDGEYIIFKFPDRIPEIKSPVKEKLDEYKIRIELMGKNLPVELAVEPPAELPVELHRKVPKKNLVMCICMTIRKVMRKVR